MKRTFVILACLFFVFAALSGCADKVKQELSIGVLPDVDSVPVIIAEKNGYFEQEGLDIRIEKFTSAMERDSALQTGAIDGAVSDILSAAFFKQGGFNVSITSMTNGSYKLVTAKGISDISFLKGKSIAVSSNTIIEYATDRMLYEYGLKPEDVIKTAIPKIPLRLEMLKNGKVNAATLPEPFASSAVNSGAVVLDSTDKLAINPGVIVFSQSATDTKSDEIKAFYRAYNKAVEYLKTADRSDYIDSLIGDTGFPEDVRDSLSLPEYTKAALPSLTNFQGVMDWLLGKQLIKNAYSYEELVDSSFAGS